MADAEGLRVIIVEDEPLLLMEMEDMLEDAGCIVAGTATRTSAALELAAASDYDVALLDMNLGGERVDAVAECIAKRGLPIIFVTGYGARPPPRGIEASVVDKPCTPAKLLPLLGQVRERLRG